MARSVTTGSGDVGRIAEGHELMAAYTHTEAVSFIWSVADIIRDAGYHQSDYGDVILPFTVLRRLDQASQQTRDKALAAAENLRARGFSGEGFDQGVEHAVGRRSLLWLHVRTRSRGSGGP